MSLLKRYILFILGIACQSTGVALVVKSLLGTSPISSLPYVLSLGMQLSLGETTFIINMIFLLAQIIILRKDFQKVQLLQIPATFIFASLIDLAMYMCPDLPSEIYPVRFALFLLGAACVSMGVALQVIANVLMLAGEAVVKAISDHWRLKFGRVKTFFDSTLVTLAALYSWTILGSVEGIREGTLISALITGTMAHIFMRIIER